jgi:hypothetical protein
MGEVNQKVLNLTLSPILRVQSVINFFLNVIFNKKEPNYTPICYLSTAHFTVSFSLHIFSPLFLQICCITSC